MMKKVLAALGGVVALLLVLPAVLPAHVRVERAASIAAKPDDVYTYLVDLNQYQNWNPFSENDPTATSQVAGSGIGSSLTWKGEKTGEGKMTISGVEPTGRVRLNLDFYTPMEGAALVEWRVEAIDGGKSRMTWSLEEDLSYFHRYFGLVTDRMIGAMFEKGLQNLKGQLEKHTPSN